MHSTLVHLKYSTFTEMVEVDIKTLSLCCGATSLLALVLGSMRSGAVHSPVDGLKLLFGCRAKKWSVLGNVSSGYEEVCFGKVKVFFKNILQVRDALEKIMSEGMEEYAQVNHRK